MRSCMYNSLSLQSPQGARMPIRRYQVAVGELIARWLLPFNLAALRDKLPVWSKPVLYPRYLDFVLE